MTTTTVPATPDFDDEQFLESHVRFILAFYEDRVIDPEGGFYQTYTDTGEIVDPELKHLVSSTRFVYNYATAFRRYGTPQYREWAERGLTFLQTDHRQKSGHYAWELGRRSGKHYATDDRAMAYGHAFVILAAASSVLAGIEAGEQIITETYDFVESHFWSPEHNAYADERDGSLQVLDPYRGQNANMHMCEALIAAFEATGQDLYIERALKLARKFAVDLAAHSDGLIWEHYTTDWLVDPNYNIDKPDDLFKPWGFQPGHQVEWSKLLLQLDSHRPADWLKQRARDLFGEAMKAGWDNEFGGLVYGFGPDGQFCDSHKYFWVHAEAFAAAYRLHKLTGEDQYLAEYNRIWNWSWQHLVDHKDGAWFRIRNRDGSAFDNLKSPPGKTDYHTLGACWDVLDTMTRKPS